MLMSTGNSTAQFNSIVHVGSHMITALDGDDGERDVAIGVRSQSMSDQGAENK